MFLKPNPTSILLLLTTLLLSIPHTPATNLCPLATTPTTQSTLLAAKSVLDNNWVSSMNATLPSPNLYPHQWSWDAAFVAIGYSHYSTPRAIAETNALFRGQWANGLLPHIVFNPSTDETYFPGPAFWNIRSSPHAPPLASTSGIVQPPVHAIASLAIFRNARSEEDREAAMEHLEFIFPKLKLWHDYLYNNRDPLNEGLVFIRHMWESGMDNSPAWDDALEAIKLTSDMIPEYTRVDKGKVGHAKERPTSFFYDRAVYLIKIFYDNKYDEAAIFKHSPFLVQDVLFNSILARAGHALADIADILHRPNDARLNRLRAQKTAAAITSKLYDPVEKFFFDYDMVAKRLIRNKISGGFVALFGAALDRVHVDAMLDHLYSDGFLGEDLSSWTIPSVSKEDPGYTNTTYWKGPAWLNINYLVREGLVRNGAGNKRAERIAEYLKDRSIEMINSVGFFEYFNPISGSPHGGHQFSWSAALVIDWLCSGHASSVIKSQPQRWNVTYGTVIFVLFGLFAASYMTIGKNEENVQDEATEIIGKKPPRGDASVVRRGAVTRVRSGSTSTLNRRST